MKLLYQIVCFVGTLALTIAVGTLFYDFFYTVFSNAEECKHLHMDNYFFFSAAIVFGCFIWIEDIKETL